MRLSDDEQKKLLSDMAKEVVRKLGLKAGSFRGIVQITPAEDSRPKEFILYFVPSEMSMSKKLMLEVLDTFSITYLNWDVRTWKLEIRCFYFGKEKESE